MAGNRLDGVPPSDALIERAVAALVREWGVSEQEAREALDRVTNREARLRRNGRVIDLADIPHQRIDLTDHERHDLCAQQSKPRG